MRKILKLTTIAAIGAIATVSVSAPAFAGLKLNGKVANGRSANGISLNGRVSNGRSYNGKVANGKVANGRALNAMTTQNAEIEAPITPVVASVRLADGSVISVK